LGKLLKLGYDISKSTVARYMLKRECLNHLIIFGRRHAMRVIREYLEYYHGSRTHLGLEMDTPDGREVEPPELGPVRRLAMVGGLHSRYHRDAA
jgi:hypothetical protein